MNPKIIGAVIIGVVLVGGSFYGGTVYAQSKASSARGTFGQTGQNGGGAFARGANGMGGLTAGEILSNDGSTMTIQMQDGSTKIVLFSGSTMITKSASGTPQDLTTGERVTVMGSANSDGSLTAQNILIGGNFGFGGRPMGGTPRGN